MTPSTEETYIISQPPPQDEFTHIDNQQDDEPVSTTDTASRTPVRLPPRSARKSLNAQKKLTPGKGKKWRTRNEGIDGECHLLNLPVDVVHLLLARLPPRSLKALSVTCRTLREDMSNESIWRQSYANRFMWDGAAREVAAKSEMKVLVQGCMGDGGRGWRREALNREAMLDRWSGSKQDMVVHYPPLGLIESISLSYPTYSPPNPRQLVVGKSQHMSAGSGSSGSTSIESEAFASPTKLTHRQRYEALIAATTRPAPYILSSSLFMGSIVRSDPLSGKTSKGFWGPGRGANVHLRPQLDQSASPSALYQSPRSQTRALWGLMDGSCVHTTLASKSQSSQGGRAASINIISAFADSHEGEICDIWMDDRASGPVRWVTGGTDGRVKYWQLVTTESARSGKRAPANDVTSSMLCLFSANAVPDSLPSRSESIKRRQSGKPDDIVIVRCASEHAVVCGITQDGDLRIWFGAGTGSEKDVRIDVGSAEEMGAVQRMEVEARDEMSASVLILHDRSTAFTRFDVKVDADGEHSINTRTFNSPVAGSFSAIQVSLQSSLPISEDVPAPPALSVSDTREAEAFEQSISQDSSAAPTPSEESSNGAKNVHAAYGRLVATGDEHGVACLWAWDEIPGRNTQDGPLRVWPAVSGRVTAIEVSCGLVAVGSFDGSIRVYDPLPDPPVLLRHFQASRLSAADAFVAASREPDARYFNVNQIILENDLIVATIGRKVFAWKAGVGKGRTKVDSHRRVNGQKSDAKSSAKNIDAKSLRQQSLDTQHELRSQTAIPVRQSNYERAQFAAMDNMGLEDGEDALQYALMLSMDEQTPETSVADSGAGTSTGDDADAELQEMLEMIRLAEERERERESY